MRLPKAPALAALLMAAAASSHAQTVTVDVAPGAIQRFEILGPAQIRYDSKQVYILLGDVPPTPKPDPKPTPTPDPVVPDPPPKPDPVTPPPVPAKKASWLVVLWDDAAQSPELADLRNSRTLGPALPGVGVVDYSDGTPDFKRFEPFAKAKGLKLPAYIFLDDKGAALGSGPVTTEAALIEASKALK